jgi:hypothetical protein
MGYNRNLTKEQIEKSANIIKQHLEKLNEDKETEDYLTMLENLKYGDR